MMDGGSDEEEKNVAETANPKLDEKRLEFCEFIRGAFKTSVKGGATVTTVNFKDKIMRLCCIYFIKLIQGGKLLKGGNYSGEETID